MKRAIIFILLIILCSNVVYGITGNSGSNKGFGYFVKKIYYSPDNEHLLVEGYFINSTNDIIQKVNTVRFNINSRDGFVIAQAVSGNGLEKINLEPGKTKNWNFILSKPVANKDISWTEYNIDYDYDIGKTINMGSGIKVFYEGEKIKYDVPPSVIKNRILIPARLTFERMGAEVDWDATIQTVKIKRAGRIIIIKVGDCYMLVDDKKVALDVPAQVIDNRTLIPLRAVSVALDCVINWGDEDKIVVIADGK